MSEYFGQNFESQAKKLSYLRNQFRILLLKYKSKWINEYENMNANTFMISTLLTIFSSRLFFLTTLD